MKPNIIIFASGNGSNAVNIIQYFYENQQANVSAVFTNKKDAGVVRKVIDSRVALQYFNKEDFYNNGRVIELVKIYQPDIIVLAGFLWLVPSTFIEAFNDRIINLHPSLLPKYGGKGMYGHFVHEAVLNAGETESGITIHKVNKEFDKGDIIFQAKCNIEPNETVESLSHRIHVLEHENFPKVIAKLLNK